MGQIGKRGGTAGRHSFGRSHAFREALPAFGRKIPGYDDPDYFASEILNDVLNSQRGALFELQATGKALDTGAQSVKIESRTNLLFSFEKMALRDAVKSEAGAKAFAEGLFAFLYGRAGDRRRFDDWCAVIGTLPRKQTRVLTWPMATAFGFIAQPDRHIFLKPNVTRRAAEIYGFPFHGACMRTILRSQRPCRPT